MTINQYIKEAKRTCPSLGSHRTDVTHMYLGMITELAEVVDVFKKNIAYNKPMDLINLQEELCGDVPWYVANLMTFEGYDSNGFEINTIKNDYSKLSNEELSWKVCTLIQVILNGEFDYYEVLWQEIYDISVALNLDFYKGLENNINKLKQRFPEGFTAEKALNRNLEAERKELEK